MALGALALRDAAAAARSTLVPAQSEIVFASKQMGVPVEGRFKRFDARIVLDPRRPETGNVTITIDTGSATFGLPEPDSELPKPAWFDVGRFPQATFQSTAIKAAGEGRLEVAGTLRIKGFARDCVMPVTLTPAGSNHHRHRSLQREAARLQDRRRRVVRHVDGGQRSAGRCSSSY